MYFDRELAIEKLLAFSIIWCGYGDFWRTIMLEYDDDNNPYHCIVRDMNGRERSEISDLAQLKKHLNQYNHFYTSLEKAKSACL